MLVDWLVARGPERPVLASFPGSALRLVAHAEALGRPLPPTTFILGGEPVSRLKRERLEARGHSVYPWYGAVDAGRLAIGCLKPERSDDMHLLTDRFAAISAGGRLLLTSLDPAVHKRFLNTDFGDLARLSQRRCGCPLDLPGFDRHISDVRSVQKLCLEGITLPADVVHSLVEERLPAACGGAPDDYQLVEEEAEDGWTRLVVRVAPGLAVDESVVIATLERVLLEAAGGARAEAERLRRAGVVVVRRERPQFSRGGKVLAGQVA
jgi:phenylacetate-coenzyme A ligase PaaK-like adenylate-forming protein